MTKKERIEELERRVQELEARSIPIYLPIYIHPTPPPIYPWPWPSPWRYVSVGPNTTTTFTNATSGYVQVTG